MASTLTVITGASRGLGLEMSVALARAGQHVLMLARDVKAGQAAITSRRELQTERVALDTFDVAQTEDIPRLLAKVKSIAQPGWRVNFINNAAVAPRGAPTEQLLHTIVQTNVQPIIRLVAAFVPVLERYEGGTIINFTSGLGNLSNFQGTYRDFVLNAKNEWTLESLEKGSTPVPLLLKDLETLFAGYSLSKGLVNRITELQAQAWSCYGAVPGKTKYGSSKVAIAAVDPGWCQTDMGGPQAPLKAEDGADTAVWLLTTSHDPAKVNGRTFNKRREYNWRQK